MLVELDPAVDTRDTDPAFRADVLDGLSLRQKAVPARWLYDHAGSELFEAITALPEYYPTRTEIGLLERYCPAVADAGGRGRVVVEFGSGSSAKTPLLLGNVDPAAYVPIDISGNFLRESASALARRFPALPIYPVEADFLKPITLPREISGARKLGFFPGSTIGNMAASAAVDLLRNMSAALGSGALLLIGMDRVKDASILVPAYDDAQGVTAQFDLNLLRRINAELGGTMPVDRFLHRAIWNDADARIEMHLEAITAVAFTVAGRRFSMAAGETIHTENSHKYDARSARLLLSAGGWSPLQEWTDDRDQFALILAEARPEPIAP